MAGTFHYIGDWDLLIAHPPCTYLSNVSAWSFSAKYNNTYTKTLEYVVNRWEQRTKAAVFFMYFALANVKHICVENPVGFMNSAYRKPDQIIHPYMFASSENDKENYVTKRTCLWLRNLPKLKTNDLPKPNNKEIYKDQAANCWCKSITKDRAKVRSKTFQGIADAMAEQWGNLERKTDEKSDESKSAD